MHRARCCFYKSSVLAWTMLLEDRHKRSHLNATTLNPLLILLTYLSPLQLQTSERNGFRDSLFHIYSHSPFVPHDIMQSAAPFTSPMKFLQQRPPMASFCQILKTVFSSYLSGTFFLTWPHSLLKHFFLPPLPSFFSGLVAVSLSGSFLSTLSFP